MTEVWASAPREYHEFYEISNLGGARSLPRVTRGRNGSERTAPSKHPYAGENLKIRTYDGARICVECSRRWAREHYHRKKVRNE